MSFSRKPAPVAEGMWRYLSERPHTHCAETVNRKPGRPLRPPFVLFAHHDFYAVDPNDVVANLFLNLKQLF
jgi:hypothetical protein